MYPHIYCTYHVQSRCVSPETFHLHGHKLLPTVLLVTLTFGWTWCVCMTCASVCFLNRNPAYAGIYDDYRTHVGKGGEIDFASLKTLHFTVHCIPDLFSVVLVVPLHRVMNMGEMQSINVK